MSVTKITIHVDNLSGVTALYDLIQVWRSPDKSGSPTAYVEITAADQEPAKINGTVEAGWNLNGQSLTITFDGGTPFTVSFIGTNPWNLNQVLAAINNVKAGIASEVSADSGTVAIQSPTRGSGSSVLLSGSAVATLGLSTTKANGLEARILFATPTEEYFFQDLDGSSSFWYKVRYYSSTTGAVSSFSDPHQGIPQTVVPSNSTVIASANLMDGAGRPLVGRRLIFVPTGYVQTDGTDGNPFASLPSVDRIIATTDETGHAETPLLIGQDFRVFFEGTTFQRDFTVPDADFDLFSVLSTKPDPFTIVQAPPMPIRVS